jgi:hypothetical protein
MQVSPGRQRKTKESLKSLLRCPWEIKWSPLERGQGKDSSEIAIKITNGNFVHACKPGIRSQAEAIKKSGAAFDFSAKKAAMEQIVGILDSGPVPPSTLRNLIRSHVPANVPIAASDLHNFRVRALAYSLKEKRLDPDDVKKLLQFEEHSVFRDRSGYEKGEGNLASNATGYRRDLGSGAFPSEPERASARIRLLYTKK